MKKTQSETGYVSRPSRDEKTSTQVPDISKFENTGRVKEIPLKAFTDEDLDKLRKIPKRRKAMTADDINPYTPKGRILRKAFERPRPDLPADAPVNRNRKQISLSLPRDLIDEVNEAAKTRGVDRNALIETAIRRMLGPK